jgi:hypothetical protein
MVQIGLAALLRRDHDDIARGLDELADPGATLAQIRGALDGVRLGLLAHSEAEDIVMDRAVATLARPAPIAALVARARAAHLEQEGALSALVCAVPGTQMWRDRALALKALVREHAAYEEVHVLAAIERAASPDAFARLAGEFATERLRQLAMLQPSAPIYIGSGAAMSASA